MPYIYTIAHPLTGQIVYVGATQNFNNRKRLHHNHNKSAASEFVQELAKNYMLPKIEVLEICDLENMYELETYWINQLTTWGFVLLNKNKVNKAIKFYAKTRKPMIGAVIKLSKERNNSKWTDDALELGKQYIVDPKKMTSFREMFRQYAKKFGKNVYLKYHIIDGQMTGIVTPKREKNTKPYRLSKSGKRLYYELKPRDQWKKPMPEPKLSKRPLERYFAHKMVIGQSVSIDRNKWESFKVTVKQHQQSVPDLRFYYEPDYENDKIICTRIPFDSDIIQPSLKGFYKRKSA